MKVNVKALAIAVAMLCTGGISTQAANLTFDENAIPVNALNGFTSFTFGDFGTAGAVTTTASSIILDIQDSDSNNGVFGGVGVDFVVEDSPGSGVFVNQDFDATTHQWEVRVKKLPNNSADVLNTVMVDLDSATTGDEYQYNFDLNSIPDDGNFHTIIGSLLTPGFSQPAFGLSAGNGVVDPGASQLQLQSAFGSTGRMNVEVDFARIVPIIPEPTSLALASLGCVAIGLSSRRRG